MCRVLAYIGPEVPVENLLLKPENSLINQALDPERHPDLQLAGWGFGAWGEHLLKPEEPFIYCRPMAAFYDDNAERIIPSLQANTMLAHVRAAAYNSKTLLVVVVRLASTRFWPTRTATPSPLSTPLGSSPRTATCQAGNSCKGCCFGTARTNT